MCILLKLNYSKFGIFNLFFENLSKNLCGSPRPPPSLSNKEPESCKDIVLEIVKLADAKTILSDIHVSHILPAASIIVAFNSRTARNEFYHNRFNLNGKTVKDLWS